MKKRDVMDAVLLRAVFRILSFHGVFGDFHLSRSSTSASSSAMDSKSLVELRAHCFLARARLPASRRVAAKELKLTSFSSAALE